WDGEPTLPSDVRVFGKRIVLEKNCSLVCFPDSKLERGDENVFGSYSLEPNFSGPHKKKNCVIITKRR
ncbi:MAG: hypothetical protein Q7S34_02930, partial [bacterium]|nr:hypothetical protein [bacterium]